MRNYAHKLKKVFTETRLDGKEIPLNTKLIQIIRKAEQDKELYRYNDKTFFCCYKTIYEEKPAVLFLFMMELPGPSSGSSTASEHVIGILRLIEKQFTPLADTFFDKEIDVSTKTNVGLLRIIKVLEED